MNQLLHQGVLRSVDDVERVANYFTTHVPWSEVVDGTESMIMTARQSGGAISESLFPSTAGAMASFIKASLRHIVSPADAEIQQVDGQYTYAGRVGFEALLSMVVSLIMEQYGVSSNYILPSELVRHGIAAVYRLKAIVKLLIEAAAKDGRDVDDDDVMTVLEYETLRFINAGHSEDDILLLSNETVRATLAVLWKIG